MSTTENKTTETAIETLRERRKALSREISLIQDRIAAARDAGRTVERAELLARREELVAAKDAVRARVAALSAAAPDALLARAYRIMLPNACTDADEVDDLLDTIEERLGEVFIGEAFAARREDPSFFEAEVRRVRERLGLCGPAARAA